MPHSRLDLLRYAFSSVPLQWLSVMLGLNSRQQQCCLALARIISIFLCSIALLWHLEGVRVAFLRSREKVLLRLPARGGRLQARCMTAVFSDFRGAVSPGIFVVTFAQVTTFREISLQYPNGDCGSRRHGHRCLIVLAVGQLVPVDGSRRSALVYVLAGLLGRSWLADILCDNFAWFVRVLPQ